MLDQEGSDLEGEFGTLGSALRMPDSAIDLAGLAAAVRLRHLTFRLSGLAAHAGDPGLAGRIRGAFGKVLMASASPESLAGAPCPWTPPCAFEALFRKQGRMTAGIDFPSPWLIALDPVKGDLLVKLTLFGLACEWAPAAAEAMTEALVEHVDWAGATGLFVPKRQIISRRLNAVDGLTLEDHAVKNVSLDFISPLVISNIDPSEDPIPAFTGFGHRLEGIARWHALTLQGINWNHLASDIRRCGFEWQEVVPVVWPRGSKRQNRIIGMDGVVGTMTISGDPNIAPDVCALLRLGEAFHVGADIAFGCGRYSMRAMW